MDYDKLIERLRWWAEQCDRTNHGCQARHILSDAATAIETIRAENERLRADKNKAIESLSKIVKLTHEQRDTAIAALARVTAERDAAVKDLNEFLAMDELCPIQCEWCKWNGTYCDGKTPEWRGIKED